MEIYRQNVIRIDDKTFGALCIQMGVEKALEFISNLGKGKVSLDHKDQRSTRQKPRDDDDDEF